MQSWQAALVVFATILIATSSCDYFCEGEEARVYSYDCGGYSEYCSYYYDLLENALLNDSNNTYALQQLFFPLSGEIPTEVHVDVTIILGGILNTSCEYGRRLLEPSSSIYDADCAEYYQYYQWLPSKGGMTEVMLESLPFFEPTISILSVFSGYYNYSRHNTNRVYKYNFANIQLKLEQVPCRVTCDSPYCSLAHLITWAKSYARARGRPGTLDESDRGQVADYSFYGNSDIQNGVNVDPHSHAIDKLLVVCFVLLNVLVMLIMVRFIPSYYLKFVGRVNSEVNSNTRHVYLSFYWGVALVLFFLAMTVYLLDLAMYIFFFTTKHINKTYLGICFSTKLAVTVMELIVCAIVCKRNIITVHIPFQWFITNVLFCCYCCCCGSSTQKSKVVQTLALWGIMVFVQHITSSLIPVGSDIIKQPAETLSILALTASTVFCTIIVVTHLLHLGKVTGYQERAAFCMQIFGIVLFISLAGVLIALYLLLLETGYELGFGGFLGSLIPSVILSAAGWYIKTRFLDTKPIGDPKSIQLTQPTAPNPTTEPDQHEMKRGDGILESVVVHRNVPELESDGKRTPLLWNMN